MMRVRVYALVLPAVLITGCAGAITSSRRLDHGPDEVQSTEIQGTLVEARHYLETGAIGEAHTLCAFLSALGEAPLGIVDDNGTLVLLTSQPSRIAAYVAQRVRVTGALSADGHMVIPRTLQIKSDTAWTSAEP